MNRADLLYSVLQDGREHSRADIVGKVGFFLTNNAASELRARGIDVHHRVRGGLHVYSLGAATEGPLRPSPTSVPAPSEPTSNPTGDAPAPADEQRDGRQLALEIPPSAYEEVAA